MKPLPSQKRLKEVLNYDPESGVFTWKPRLGCQIGRRIGTDNGNGYLRITVDGRSCYAHRLAWIFVHGDEGGEHIDHINGVRQDNRIANLRSATPSENQRNRQGAQSNSKSRTLGVSWHEKSGKWQVHRHGQYLGLYETLNEAATAYGSTQK